jgi:hypothetical protein
MTLTGQMSPDPLAGINDNRNLARALLMLVGMFLFGPPIPSVEAREIKQCAQAAS